MILMVMPKVTSLDFQLALMKVVILLQSVHEAIAEMDAIRATKSFYMGRCILGAKGK